MSDVFTKEKRSEIMSKIGSVNTKPELIVRTHLHTNGFRYRLHDKKLPGCPDLVLKQHKIAIQVNGCFWHGHFMTNCSSSKMPKTNTEFWMKKIAANIQRDRSNKEKLNKLGWTVIEIWDCELKRNKDQALKNLLRKMLHIKKTK